MLTVCRIKRQGASRNSPMQRQLSGHGWNAATQRFKARFKTCLQTRGEMVSGTEKSPKTADQEPTACLEPRKGSKHSCRGRSCGRGRGGLTQDPQGTQLLGEGELEAFLSPEHVDNGKQLYAFYIRWCVLLSLHLFVKPNELLN